MADQLPDNQPEEAARQAGMASLARAVRISFILLVAAMVLVIGRFLAKSVFVVEQHEVGMVLRFGRLLTGEGGQSVLKPGSHLTLPFPVDEKVRVPKERVQTLTSDAFWYVVETDEKGDAVVPPTLRPGRDGYTLTGNTNIIHSRWSLRYRIADPARYSFALANADDDFQAMQDVLRLLLNSAVTRASASLTVDDVWLNRNDRFRLRVEELLRARLKGLGLGVQVDKVLLTQPVPPRQVKAAFDAVMQAESERHTIVTEARGFRTRTESQAKTGAAAIRAAAEASKVLRKGRADADLEAFGELIKEAAGNRRVVIETLYENTMRLVFANVDEKFIIDGRPGRKVQIGLNRQNNEEKSK